MILIACAALVCALPLHSERGASSKPKGVATVNGKPITEEELNKAAAAKLEELELQRLQFQANYERNRQQVLQSTLDRLIEEKLVAAEAAKRGITEKELLAKEVDSKVHPPTPEEVNAFYEANKARINQPKEKISAQIQQYLQQQAPINARNDFIQRLKKEYQTVTYLEPLRTKIETAGEPSLGPANAPVTLIEFSDFQCPFCKAFASTLKEVEKNYPKDVRVVFRQFPLSNIHPYALKAAEASLCSQEQGHFWELHDEMFADQSALKIDDLKAKAAKLKLDTGAFNACLDSGKFAKRVTQEVRDGSIAGVSGTPAIFINGRFLSGAQPYPEVAKVIDQELKKSREKR